MSESLRAACHQLFLEEHNMQLTEDEKKQLFVLLHKILYADYQTLDQTIENITNNL